MFVPMDAAAYRKLDANAYAKRRAEVVELATNVPEDATEEFIRSIDAEINTIKAEDARREQLEQVRSAKAQHVAAGEGNTVKEFKVTMTERNENALESPEYERAFAAYVTEGKAIPAEFADVAHRAAQVGTTADSGAAIPVSVQNQIIDKMEKYGTLYAGVTKTNIAGGVKYPVNTLDLAASWIGETKVSDTQKLAVADVSFNYYQLECRTAQSLLSNTVSIPAFNAKYAELTARAMVKALEQGIVSGTGNNQMTGITVDSRVKTKIALKAADFAFDTLYKKVKTQIKPAYGDGIFIMNHATFDAYIDGMTDKNGQPVARVNYGLDGNEVYRFLGRQVEVVDDFLLKSFDDAQANEAFAIYCKLSDYAINSNLNITHDVWEDKDTNNIKSRDLLIVDGKPLDTNGMFLLTKSA